MFKPYAGVSTAILLFTKTDSGGTDFVWFYDLQADGWSLDDKRQPLLSEDKLGPVPEVALSDVERAKNNLPDVLARWAQREGAERGRPRTAQSFCVARKEIEANGYDLSLNRSRRSCTIRPPIDCLRKYSASSTVLRSISRKACAYWQRCCSDRGSPRRCRDLRPRHHVQTN